MKAKRLLILAIFVLGALIFLVSFGIMALFRNARASQVQKTYAVDRTDDADVSGCTAEANDCTLRGAITAANASGGLDMITFVVTGTITLGTELPAINDNLIIDGGNNH